MSYREENGQVVLTMSRNDYCFFLMAFGIAVSALHPENPLLSRIFNTLNRLNDGNSNYTPYQVEKP